MTAAVVAVGFLALLCALFGAAGYLAEVISNS